MCDAPTSNHVESGRALGCRQLVIEHGWFFVVGSTDRLRRRLLAINCHLDSQASSSLRQLLSVGELRSSLVLVPVFMADIGIVVPPGQSAPFATVTPTDHSAWIIISTALGLSMSLLFAAIRVFIRSATKHGYEKDDLVLAAATVRQLPFGVTYFTGSLTLLPATGKCAVYYPLECVRRWARKVEDSPGHRVIERHSASKWRIIRKHDVRGCF